MEALVPEAHQTTRMELGPQRQEEMAEAASGAFLAVSSRYQPFREPTVS